MLASDAGRGIIPALADSGEAAGVAAAVSLIGLATVSAFRAIPEERDATVFAFEDAAQTGRWSNLPEGIVQRGGLRLGNGRDEPVIRFGDQLRAEVAAGRSLDTHACACVSFGLCCDLPERPVERGTLFPTDHCHLDKVNLQNRKRDTPTYFSSSSAAVSTA